MYDLEICLNDSPGALALLGTTLGVAGISVEGGGAWVTEGKGVAHFLFHDGAAARGALESAGIEVAACRRVLRLRLKQEVPGQLGLITGHLARANVNIAVLYSDHANHLILVVDDVERAEAVVADWMTSQRAETRRQD
ncbi:amino acid-binding ACT domain-containing protein [Acidobacteria bacterium AB60]|nr:amino acid-binding ACT domain-containing protein [Acidobacteria bacterium AB60]